MILCERKTVRGRGSDGTKNVIEKELQPHLTRFEQQLNFFKRTAIGKLKLPQTLGAAEKEVDSYIDVTMGNVRKIALMIFTEYIRGFQAPVQETESALVTGCERFIAIISHERMDGFEKDIHQHSLNPQAKKKLAQLPRVYIPVVAPVLLDNVPPSEHTIADLRALAINQLIDNISCMKTIFSNAYKIKTIFTDSDEDALKSISTLTHVNDGQRGIDDFVKNINEIAGNRIEKNIEKLTVRFSGQS